MEVTSLLPTTLEVGHESYALHLAKRKLGVTNLQILSRFRHTDEMSVTCETA